MSKKIEVEKDVLVLAVDEIKTLQKANEYMRGRLDMFDQLMTVLHTQVPANISGRVHPGPLWGLEEALRKLERKEALLCKAAEPS